jgi:D-glycero-D-manno-heptose 1,7-bisphosphate phosphatase
MIHRDLCQWRQRRPALPAAEFFCPPCGIPRLFWPRAELGRLYALIRLVKLGVFIERDGILNTVRVERQYQVSPLTLEDFHINQDAVPLVQRLKAAGLLLIATTNQPGLSRGYQSRRELDRMHERLSAAFHLDDILVCPHDETDRCPCRKPKPGLLVEAAFKWHLNLDRSFVISDKWPDAEAARTAGCTSFLLQSPWLGNVHRDFLLPDLPSIIAKILVLKAKPRAMAG